MELDLIGRLCIVAAIVLLFVFMHRQQTRPRCSACGWDKRRHLVRTASVGWRCMDLRACRNRTEVQD